MANTFPPYSRNLIFHATFSRCLKIPLLFFGLLLLLQQGVQAQKECSVNAGPDQKICFDRPMVLNAPFSADYDLSAGLQWTFISGPAGATAVPLNPTAFSTPVTGGPNWPLGPYVFEFCATCKDLNGSGSTVRLCDNVTITAMPQMPAPSISPASVVACKEAVFTVTPPNGPDETAKVYIDDDGKDLFETMIVGNQLIIKSSKIGKMDFLAKCDYEVTYTITNGGCSASASAMVRLAEPYDKNGDGIVEGHVEPSCDSTLALRGDRPGCGRQGVWTVTGPGSVTFVKQDLPNGDADVTVTAPGIYTLTYTVTGGPCPPSTYTITYQVVDLKGFRLVPEVQEFPFCDNTLPAGNYCFTYNVLEHATYEWFMGPYHQSEVVITNPHSNTSCLKVTNPIDLTDHSVYVTVIATRYFLDPDCDGPILPFLVEIPSMDPDSIGSYLDSVYTANIDTFWVDIIDPFTLDTIRLIDSISYPCPSQCWAYAHINFFGVPKIEVKSDNIQFLCSDCSEGVFLKDYVKVVNGVVATTKVTVVSQPPGSSPIVNPKLSTKTNLVGCGDYVFKVDYFPFYTSDPACRATAFIHITLQQPQPVSAGTPQEKCFNEPIRLNGNAPYGSGVVGTWKQVDCPGSDPSGGTAIFSEHDPNTVVSHGLSWGELPKRLCFEWSFASENSDCALSDITWVDVKQCTIPCPKIHVKSVCEEDRITITLLDPNDIPIDANLYDISWSISGGQAQNGLDENPLVVLNAGNPVNYDAMVSLLIDESRVCEEKVSGVATCGKEVCGARVVESCDACGMITLTLVNVQTGLPIVPHTYDDEITWWVNGFQRKNVNPISISPGSCYKLLYFHYSYDPSEPHVPGLADICKFELEETCTTLECPGPCDDFPTFIVAGYGDALATSLGLVFPPNSFSFCGTSNGLYGTIGVFSMPGGIPVNPGQYNILWENGSTNTYVTGSLMNIDYVKITEKVTSCCFWEAKYRPVCCENVPTQVHCENPIIKHCDGEGNVTYTNGSPQIAWQSVTGATGYEVRVTSLPGGSVAIYPAPYSPWIIPAGNGCIRVEVRAVFPGGMCSTANWSQPFEYCPLQTQCERTIVICGCCGRGDRSSVPQQTALREVVVPEETLDALLAATPRSRHATLQQALDELEQHTQAAFLVFPNPAQTKLELRTLGLKAGQYTVSLHDLLGRTRATLRFTETASTLMDVSDLPPGVYTLSVKDANGTALYHQKVSILR